MSYTYGAIDHEIMAEYYRNPQPRKANPHINFKRRSSFSSDAGSVTEYVEMDSIQRHKHNNNKTNVQRLYLNEFDIDIAAEPRDIYKANHMALGSAPSDNLKCLWISMLLLLIFMIASVSSIDGYIINIYGTSSISGSYYWSFGWCNSIFYPQDTSLIAEQSPLTFTKRYAADAGRLYIISIFIMILCLLLAIFILCSRCINEAYLYILCCKIRIPQSPALCVLFSTVQQYANITICAYIFVIAYGMLEMNFYLNYTCAILGGTCITFAIPHYGSLSLILISLIISCFIQRRVIKLDKGFNVSTIRYFYPDHVGKMSTGMAHINMEYIKSTLRVTRLIVIYSSVIYITFHNAGLILIAYWDKTTRSFSLFFEFQGLINEYEDITEARCFVLVCWAFHSVLLPFVLGLNTVIVLYLYYVLVSLNCTGCKWILIVLMCIEWILWILMSGLYYYTFYGFWQYLKNHLERSVYYSADHKYDVFWFPDWGIFFLIIIQWYIIKAIRFTFKCM